MATILLSAAGAAIGSGFSGTVLGLTGAVIGRAVGATLGRAIDLRALAGGSDPVETGRVDRFRVNGAGEGAVIPRLWGRMRVAGQIIWASRFLEHQTTSGGSGKGGGGRPATTSFHYTVSLAIALCEGPALSLGRIWADGVEIDRDSLSLRFYPGDATQRPDPKIEAIEGAGQVPAYRGTAYVVFEDLDLSPFGNRVPQFSFEVTRNARPGAGIDETPMSGLLPGVCLIPGSGEYALATTPVRSQVALGQTVSRNVHATGNATDFTRSIDRLIADVPAVHGASLVVSWFGDDLRCGQCTIRPKVEPAAAEGIEMPWSVAGLTRATAQAVPVVAGKAVYGGAPSDRSVIEAIQALRARGLAVTFYPFILMDQTPGNARPDPWGGSEQPSLPWRGRITTAIAPGRPGTTDRTAAANAEVAAFFGTASASHFGTNGTEVTYSGPAEWGLRRFILHYARLCALAGGVDSFLIGSELVGVMRIRGAADSFPAVIAMRALAAEVRAILGPATKISYAADWSEYSGLQADGNRYFHLDPLWADGNVDFVGIDNYLPCADWRDQPDEADAGQGGQHDLAYLMANIEGGEYYDWYYANDAARLAQTRSPITDAAEGEPWVWRPKDLRNWWRNAHHDRINGVKQPAASPWVPMSKPLRFTEYGCAALDKAANQPNRFLDPKSSESGLPFGSSGARDDLAQLRYLQAMAAFWRDPARNPISPYYGAPMLDFDNSHVWAWDARPFPAFPDRADIWSDAAAYDTGHWLNGRVSTQSLTAVIGEIAGAAGLDRLDVAPLAGSLRGYHIQRLQDARASLQPLLQVNGLDCGDREGVFSVFPRRSAAITQTDTAEVVLSRDGELGEEKARVTPASQPGQMMLSYVEDSAEYPPRVVSATFPGLDTDLLDSSDLPILLTPAEAQAAATRWLAETAAGRERLSLSLPLSRLGLRVGEALRHGGRTYRIDRIAVSDHLQIEAVSSDGSAYEGGIVSAPLARRTAPAASPQPVYPVFLDLPLLRGDEVPHAPHVAVASTPWQGDAGVWMSSSLDGFELALRLERAAMIGVTETPLPPARSDLWDRGAPLQVRFASGSLASLPDAAVLGGANLAAIGDGTPGNWEVFQFATASLVAPGRYALSRRLRGQCGTASAIPPGSWPPGSIVVLLNTAVSQVPLPADARGVTRHFRIASLAQGASSPLAIARQEAFAGIGLRPYSPCHVRATPAGAGTWRLGWIRRTRSGGDSWLGLEVPLSEESESYEILLRQGPTQLRRVQTGQASFDYTAAMQASDGATGTLTAEIRQISVQFGAGPPATISFAL